MRMTITHKTPQDYTGETIEGEGEDYETLRDELLAQVPEGRIAASILTNRDA